MTFLKKNGLSIVALILAIVALIFAAIPTSFVHSSNISEIDLQGCDECGVSL